MHWSQTSYFCICIVSIAGVRKQWGIWGIVNDSTRSKWVVGRVWGIGKTIDKSREMEMSLLLISIFESMQMSLSGKKKIGRSKMCSKICFRGE